MYVSLLLCLRLKATEVGGLFLSFTFKEKYGGEDKY